MEIQDSSSKTKAKLQSMGPDVTSISTKSINSDGNCGHLVYSLILSTPWKSIWLEVDIVMTNCCRSQLRGRTMLTEQFTLAPEVHRARPSKVITEATHIETTFRSPDVFSPHFLKKARTHQNENSPGRFTDGVDTELLPYLWWVATPKGMSASCC